MTYQMKALACDPARLQGLSERLIVSHYENNYGGAVKRLGAITDRWVLLSWSPRLGRLSSQWAPDHAHTLADGTPLLALDMYEHAYHLDFGAKAAAYVDAFMQNINWTNVAARFTDATR